LRISGPEEGEGKTADHTAVFCIFGQVPANQESLSSWWALGILVGYCANRQPLHYSNIQQHPTIIDMDVFTPAD